MEIDKQRVAELVVKVQGGDDAAFKELYELTSKRAFFVALEFVKNDQDAEDILQDSYIKALSKIGELDKPESFSSWFNQIVANKSKDFLKKKKPSLFEAEENEVFEVIPDEDTAFTPEGNLDQTELQRTVMEVLDELSEEKRACVLMMYFEELSVGEIAETLEIPEGTVKTRLFSARKDLKNKFEKRGITSAFSLLPIGVVVWALRRTSETVQLNFAESAASAKVFAGITAAGTGTAASVAAASGAAATTAAVSTGTASATAVVGTSTASATTAAAGAATAASAAAGGAAATGAGVAAKIAALTVAQKVVAGVSVAAVVAGSTAGVVTVVNNNEAETATAYTEEYTTAPSFETTLAVEAMGTVEFSETTTDLSQTSETQRNVSTARQSETEKQSTSAAKTTAKSGETTTKPVTRTTTTKKTTTTTTKKVTTTTKPTTTKATTTTTKPTTTTTRPTTTTKPTTTTTKPTTTKEETTTKAASPATVTVSVEDSSGNVVQTAYLEYDEGETITNSNIKERLLDEHGINAMVFAYNQVAEAGGNYSVTAYSE